jgi:SAM-dependent methyltransferase
MPTRSVDELLAEAADAPIVGWDFSWLEGRATEERPTWGYSGLAAARVGGGARSVLDIETGGGEVFEEILCRAGRAPERLAATEGWPPNLEVARARLGPLGVHVAEAPDGGVLPFPDAAFDLVLSRHPNRSSWTEIARVLAPGGTYLAQHIGAGSNRELTEYFLGPQALSDVRSAGRARAEALAAGLEVRDLREESLRVEFFDVGAVVYFLRLVVWTVPGFDVERARDRLVALHEEIEVRGSFVSHARRQLIEAVRPAG